MFDRKHVHKHNARNMSYNFFKKLIDKSQQFINYINSAIKILIINSNAGDPCNQKRLFKETEMKSNTIGELCSIAHAHSQLPPSHWLTA